MVSPIGYGAFKIGRNHGIKYPQGYPLPDDDEAARILNAVLDLGINVIDTAPAYGLSERRIGAALAARREEYVLSTKVGETFVDGQAQYDFSRSAVVKSVRNSLSELRTDRVDLLLVHSDGRDVEIQNQTDVVATIQQIRDRGEARAIGFSGKTIQGAQAAMQWADCLMVEYNLLDETHLPVMQEAARRSIGILVKKGLASGHLPAARAIPFVLRHESVSSLIVGGLNLEHLRTNVRIATEVAVAE